MRHLAGIGLDLDGTLLDTAPRHKAALLEAAHSLNVGLPDGFPDRYYEEKRGGLKGTEVLLRHHIPRSAELSAAWARLIECERLLMLDVPFPDVLAAMGRMADDGFGFHLCTARQQEDLVIRQLSLLGIAPLIRGAHVLHLDDHGGPSKTKAEITSTLGLNAIVGDSEVDMEWATKLNVRFLALSCGARSREFWLARRVEPYEDTVSALRAVCECRSR